MATSTSEKSLCAICGKVKGLFTCKGCQKDFCIPHVAEHRQELSKQIDELTLVHDQFRQSLDEQRTELRHHPLMKQIDEWERQSIDKIRHAADDARQQIQKTISEHTEKLTEAVVKIAQELCKAREDNDFFETDLKQWTEKLDKLKNDLAEPSNVNIRQENNSAILFMPKLIDLSSSKEVFARSIGNIRIEDNGQVIARDQSDGYATVRGGNDYVLGQHRCRFKIEVFDSHKWLFFGIISKDVSIEEKSYDSRTSYGWAGYDQVYISGVQQNGFNGYKTDVEMNDIVELLIDCDRGLIRLTNERTHSAHTLQVNASDCPFPWQLNFNLYWPNDCVRILQT